MKRIFLPLIAFFSINSYIHAQSWTELGNNLNANGAIADVCIDNVGNVYAAGWFYNSSFSYYVAKWDGSTWIELGTGANSLGNFYGGINSLCTDPSGNVYAGSAYSPTTQYYNVNKWNGTTWSQVGGLNANSDIKVITSDAQGNIYAAGDFTDAPASSSGQRYVAKWNGTTWTELGTGANALNPNGFIQILYTDAAGNLYAGGEFTNALGKRYVAKWNGTTWTELGTGVNALNANEEIEGITSDSQGNIYATGVFTDGPLSNMGKQYVAKWNGTNWTELGTGSNALNPNEHIEHLLVDPIGNVYASGWFTNSAGKYYVAKWDGTSWTELGGTNNLNANSGINAMRFDPAGNMYVAGNFTDAVGMRYVARLNMASIDSINAHTLNNIPSLISTNAGTLQLAANVYPAAADQSVTWSINSNTIASIASGGLVTAISNGLVWATATSVLDTLIKDSVEITITNQIVLIDSISVQTENNVSPAITTAGGSLQLAAKIYPLTANQNVTWSVLQSGTASISGSGLVTAIANGAVWAKAKSVQDPSEMDSLKILISGQGDVSSVDAVESAIGFKIYPNPSDSRLVLETDLLNDNADIYIYSVAGDLMQSEHIKGNRTIIDIENYIQGTYFIEYKSKANDIKVPFAKK